MVIEIFSILVAFAQAEGLETKYLRSLTQEHSSMGIEQTRRDYERARILRTACAIELREKLVPTSCYEELSFLPLSQDERRFKIAKLDRLCVRAARRLPPAMRFNASLSTLCAAEIRQAKANQDYRAEENPSDWSEN